MPELRPPSQAPGPVRQTTLPNYGTPPLTRGKWHIVGTGDTIEGIAAAYGHASGAAELYNINAACIEKAAADYGYGNSHHGTLLIPGTRLDIPGSW